MPSSRCTVPASIYGSQVFVAPFYIRRMTAKLGSGRRLGRRTDCSQFTVTPHTCMPLETEALSFFLAMGGSIGESRRMMPHPGCLQFAEMALRYGLPVRKALLCTQVIGAKPGS